MLPNSLNDFYVRELIADKHREARAAQLRGAMAESRRSRRGVAQSNAFPGNFLKRGARPAIGFLKRLLVTDR